MCPQPLSPDPSDPYFNPLKNPLEKYRDIGYFRRGGFWRRWGRLMTALAVVGACLLAVGLSTFGARDRRVFQSRRLSVAHGSFNHDCRVCHKTGFATAERLWRGDDSIRAVDNNACAECRKSLVYPVHHEAALGTTTCASCHREHQGDVRLASVGGGHCTTCHADLAAHTDPTKKPKGERAYRNVSAFEPADDLHRPTRGHPEFALFTDPAPPRDPGTVRFNHRKHLNPKGLLMPNGGPRKILQCANCHVPDDAGRSMRPMRYETHCAECHPIPVTVAGVGNDPALRDAAAQFAQTSAPHPRKGEGPDTVFAVLRQRYVTFVQEHPTVLVSGGGAPRPRPVPGRPRLQHLSKTEWDWVNAQLAKARWQVFDGPQGCRYCHQEVGRGPNDLPRYALPQINDRWLTHAVFSHDSHRTHACETCHVGVHESEQTAQVLLPKVAECMTCHAPRSNAARADCFECHRYHGRDKEPLSAFAITPAQPATPKLGTGSPAPESPKGATHGGP